MAEELSKEQQAQQLIDKLKALDVDLKGDTLDEQVKSFKQQYWTDDQISSGYVKDLIQEVDSLVEKDKEKSELRDIKTGLQKLEPAANNRWKENEARKEKGETPLPPLRSNDLNEVQSSALLAAINLQHDCKFTKLTNDVVLENRREKWTDGFITGSVTDEMKEVVTLKEMNNALQEASAAIAKGEKIDIEKLSAAMGDADRFFEKAGARDPAEYRKEFFEANNIDPKKLGRQWNAIKEQAAQQLVGELQNADSKGADYAELVSKYANVIDRDGNGEIDSSMQGKMNEEFINSIIEKRGAFFINGETNHNYNVNDDRNKQRGQMSELEKALKAFRDSGISGGKEATTAPAQVTNNGKKAMVKPHTP